MSSHCFVNLSSILTFMVELCLALRPKTNHQHSMQLRMCGALEQLSSTWPQDSSRSDLTAAETTEIWCSFHCQLPRNFASCGLRGRKQVGNFNVPAIHLLILALYICVHVAYSYYLSLRTFPICFSFFLFWSCLLFYLFFYLLPSRIWTRSVFRPEVVGGDQTWV